MAFDASGKFRAAYCPSVSGCRAVVLFEDLYNGGHAIDVYDIAYVLNIETTSGYPVWMVSSLGFGLAIAQRKSRNKDFGLRYVYQIFSRPQT